MHDYLRTLTLLLPSRRSLVCYCFIVISLAILLLVGFRVDEESTVADQILRAPSETESPHQVKRGLTVPLNRLSDIIIDVKDPSRGTLKGVYESFLSNDSVTSHIHLVDPVVTRSSDTATDWSISLDDTPIPSIFGSSNRHGGSAFLWGLRIDKLGSDPNSAVQYAYLEMCHHLWLLITLPFICFWGIRPILTTFDSDFLQFLRYGKSSRLRVEAMRVFGLSIIAVMAMMPFLVTAWLGMRFLSTGDDLFFQCIASCLVPTIFVAAFAYVIRAAGIGLGSSLALAISMPFFLTGVSAFLSRMTINSESFGGELLPPGLPYTVASSRAYATGVGYSALLIAGRMLITIRTSWLPPRPEKTT